MSALEFLSPAACAPDVRLVSPLGRALADDDPIVDASSLGKLELRGHVDALEPEAGEELIRITPERTLLVTRGDVSAARDRAAASGCRAYDMTAALAAFELTGERLLRRLTPLDLESLPAVGAILRETPAVVQRLDGERFRLFVPQELGHSVAEAILDCARRPEA